MRDFKKSNVGAYTCSKTSTTPEGPDPTPAKVELIMRPRLLADYTSLSRTETNEVVMTGHRVSVPLEIGSVGRLICRTNPNFKGPIRVTWFYHGRQLIGPAASMLDEVDLTPRAGAEVKKGRKKPRGKQRQQAASDEESARIGEGTGGSSLKKMIYRPAVMDPTELGVTLENNSQVIKTF